MAADLHTALMERVRIVREYSNTEPVKHVVHLLDLVRRSLIEDLVNVKPEQLRFVQGALKQTDALHTAITGTEGYVPKAQQPNL